MRVSTMRRRGIWRQVVQSPPERHADELKQHDDVAITGVGVAHCGCEQTQRSSTDSDATSLRMRVLDAAAGGSTSGVPAHHATTGGRKHGRRSSTAEAAAARQPVRSTFGCDFRSRRQSSGGTCNEAPVRPLASWRLPGTAPCIQSLFAVSLFRLRSSAAAC